jgi:hypothetical protein
MATKQTPPVRLDDEALTIIEEYRNKKAALSPQYTNISRSDAIKHMDWFIKGGDVCMDGLEREVMFKGDKCYINMPKDWAGKKVVIVELKK